jgi:hypothetical protein
MPEYRPITKNRKENNYYQLSDTDSDDEDNEVEKKEVEDIGTVGDNEEVGENAYVYEDDDNEEDGEEASFYEDANEAAVQDEDSNPGSSETSLHQNREDQNAC